MSDDCNSKSTSDAAAGSMPHHEVSETPLSAIENASPDSIKPGADYEILRPIGHGAYGEVYLARDSNGIYRAVKVIFRESFEHDRPFEREYEGICKFERVSRSYDNQVQVFHVGRRNEPRQFYYIMELADDRNTGPEIHPDTYEPRTLRSDLKASGCLPIKACLNIGLALARALENLHDSGLIHRDVKPANIIFVNGRPKLADIGLVTDRDMSVSFVGTDGFIPPEGPGSPQADIYSLGKVLYEMSTGRDRMDYPELPTNLAEMADREAFLELNEVIRKSCQNDPEERYRSAAELHADLRRLKEGKSLRKRRRLRREVLRFGLLAGLALLTVGAIRWWQTSDAAPESSKSSGLGPVPSPSGLIAWWPGDGHGRDLVGHQNAIPVNGADYGPGLIGLAFRVNGSNQYFSVPHSSKLSFERGEPLTLEAWVYRTGDHLPFHVMGKRDTAFGCYYQMGFDSVVEPPPPPQNNWTHVVFASDGATQSIYYNGALISTLPAPCPGPNRGDLHIGSSYFYFGFEGLIDDARIYNRALTQVEIRTIHAAGAGGMTLSPADHGRSTTTALPGTKLTQKDLIAWWPADGDAVDVVKNESAVLVNGAALGPGKVGRSFALNGYGAHVEARASDRWSFGSNAFTLVLWAKFASGSGGQALVACDEGRGNHNKWIFWFNHGGIGVHVNKAGGGGMDFGHSSFAPSLNQWYHLAVSRNAKAYIFFINGVPVSTATDSRALPPVKAALTIGAAEDGNFFNGSLDDVRIYHRALSLPEIAALYHAGSRTSGHLPDRASTRGGL